jgi:hypothetical protein
VKRESGEARALPEHQKVLQEAVRGESEDVLPEVVKEELRPVVREAITEDVMRGIQEMVRLTPKAVEALTQDLESDDAVIRQRAYTLLIKYTVGHPAIINRDDDPDQKQLIVNFELPRPDAPAPAIESVVVGQSICDLCGEEKPLDQFVDGSERCRSCWETQKAKVAERFAD